MYCQTQAAATTVVPDYQASKEYDEFLERENYAALTELTRKNVEFEVKQVFNLLDSDEDGVLSSKDLQVLIPNHNEVKQMIGAQDIDMDGSINYLEFAFLMNS